MYIKSDLEQSLSEPFSAIHSSSTTILVLSHYFNHVDEKLKICSHGWLQNDFVQDALQRRYAGS